MTEAEQILAAADSVLAREEHWNGIRR